jgi:hypothetical protein
LVEAAVVPSRPGAEEWASPGLQFPPALRWQLEVGFALSEVEFALSEVEFAGFALRHLALTAPFERVAPVLEYSAAAAGFPNSLAFAA